MKSLADCQASIVDFAMNKAKNYGIDFATTWYCYLLNMDKQYFANLDEFLDLCNVEMEKRIKAGTF